MPLKLAAKRTGGNVSIVPIPVRRDKKVIVARQILTHAAYTAKFRRCVATALQREVLAVWARNRGADSLRQRNTIIALINEHRTEMHLRWR